MKQEEAIKKLEMMANGITLLPELQEACRIAVQAIKENQRYHVIGTIEECRVARKLLPMDITMSSNEYEYLQERMSKKLKRGGLTNKDASYNEGVLACKSILSAFYKTIECRYGEQLN